MLRLTSPLNRSRCKFVHQKNITSSSSSRSKNSKDENIASSSRNSKDENTSSSSSSKRCKFVHNENNSKDDDPSEGKALEGSFQRCKFEFKFEGFRRPQIGDTLDVIRFLSSYGRFNYLVRSNGNKVNLDVVLGKNLVICCVSLPMLGGQSHFHSLLTAYSELSRDVFEIVLVAHVKPGLDDKGEALFNDFFSALPCLAIPFSESDTRGNICSFIGFSKGTSCPDATAILVDPTQTILHYDNTIYRFHDYGSDWFPFLETTVEAIETQDEVLRSRLDPNNPERRFKITSDAYKKDPLIREPLSLHEDILLCDPSLVLPRIGPASAADQQSSTVSELSNKYVGLYLYQADMEFITYLLEALKRCAAQQPELVIIVVCVPLYETIEELQMVIKQRFEKHNIATPTFFHPNNSKVWRRLWRVFGQRSLEDEMIILPPNGQSGELYGTLVVERLCEKGYPFARSILLERTFTALRSLTPTSLFKGTTEKRTCLNRNGKKFTVRHSVIKGKRLLLYLDWLNYLAYGPQMDNWKLCCLLMEQYSKIQAMGWEVVFVRLDMEDQDEYHAMLAKMPWLIMPFRNAVKTLKLLFPCMPRSNKLIAFEADGRMVSTEIIKRLGKCEFNDSLFYDNLYEEISDDLYSLRSNT